MKRVEFTGVQIGLIKEWGKGERIYYSESDNIVCVGDAYRGYFLPKDFCAINKDICRDYSGVARIVSELDNQEELFRLIDKHIYGKRDVVGKVKILEFQESADVKEKDVVLNCKLLQYVPMDSIDYYINPKNKNIVIIKGFAEKGYVTLGFVMKMKG